MTKSVKTAENTFCLPNEVHRPGPRMKSSSQYGKKVLEDNKYWVIAGL